MDVTDGVVAIRDLAVYIRARPLTLTLHTTLATVDIFPGLRQRLGSSHLNATTSNPNQTLPITYTIVKQPLRGRIESKDGRRLSNFTQDQIDDGRVYYQHTAGLSSNGPWSVQTDALVVDVTTSFAVGLRGQSVNVEVAFVNINDDNRQRLLSNAGAVVDEGGSTRLTKDNLDSVPLRAALVASGVREKVEIMFVVTSPPQNGVLEVRSSLAVLSSRASEVMKSLDILSFGCLEFF